MATISERGPFQFEAQVRLAGYPQRSKTFESKREAADWAARLELQMVQGAWIDDRPVAKVTFAEALERYRSDISARKRSAPSEKSRINRWTSGPLADRRIVTLRAQDFISFRNQRLDAGKASNTVRLDLALVHHLFEIARKEWGMESLSNPLDNVSMPGGSAARERRLRQGEFEQIIDLAERFSRNAWMKPAIVLAVETGLRRSVLVQLRWDWINFERSVLNIPSALRQTDNKGVPAAIPLWPEAMYVLNAMERSADGRIIPLSPNAITCAWTRLRNASEDRSLRTLRWHDLRHEATSRLFEKGMNPIEVQAITGHKSMDMLKRYTHIRPDDLLAKYGAVRV